MWMGSQNWKVPEQKAMCWGWGENKYLHTASKQLPTCKWKNIPIKNVSSQIKKQTEEKKICSANI